MYSMQDVVIKTELVATGPIDYDSDGKVVYNLNPWLAISDGADKLIASNLTVKAEVGFDGCSVTTPSVSADLPQVFPGSFATGYAGSTPVVLSLACPHISSKIYVTLTDASTPSNRSNILSLAPGSTAKGVGLQVLKDWVPISYGPDSPAPGNPNQWFAKTSRAGAIDIPLTVRYVRTPGALSPGTVRGMATFTMSYQ